jgi:DNA polymerase III epsilon subunit-like protein
MNQPNYILVFDVETTGLIPKNNYKDKMDLNKLPYIIQLSYILYRAHDGNIVSTHNSYIDIGPKVTIPSEVTNLTQITKETCDTCGIDIYHELRAFYNAYMQADVIVSHNMEFDSKMICIELERNHSRLLRVEPMIINMFSPLFNRIKNKQLFCTMRETVNFCNIISVSAKGKEYKKLPRLSELYQKLFVGEPIGNLHNSLIDALYTLRCYLKLRLHHHIHNDKFRYIYNHMLKYESPDVKQYNPITSHTPAPASMSKDASIFVDTSDITA